MGHEAIDRSQLAYHAQRYADLIADTDLALADRVASFMLARVWSCGFAGVEGDPHQTSYSSAISTRPSDMTVPSYAATATTDLTRRQKGAYNNRINGTMQITSQEVPGSDADWLKKRQMRQLDIQLECAAATYVQNTWYFAANNLVIIAADVDFVLDELDTRWAKYRVAHDMTANMHAEMKILKHLRAQGTPLHGIKMGVSKPCCPRCREVLDAEAVEYTSFHNTPVPADRWAAPF